MLPVKPFRQLPGFCGPASLKMVLNYYGVEKTEREIASASGATSQNGVGADGLLKAAKTFGLNALVKDGATYEDIKKYILNEKTPVIIDWFSEDDGHYSVVVDIDDENIYFLDPQLGNLVAMTRETFYRVWFDFHGDFPRTRDDMILRRMIVVKKS